MLTKRACIETHNANVNNVIQPGLDSIDLLCDEVTTSLYGFANPGTPDDYETEFLANVQKLRENKAELERALCARIPKTGVIYSGWFVVGEPGSVDVAVVGADDSRVYFYYMDYNDDSELRWVSRANWNMLCDADKLNVSVYSY